jgi:hypothetical protein
MSQQDSASARLAKILGKDGMVLVPNDWLLGEDGDMMESGLLQGGFSRLWSTPSGFIWATRDAVEALLSSDDEDHASSPAAHGDASTVLVSNILVGALPVCIASYC